MIQVRRIGLTQGITGGSDAKTTYEVVATSIRRLPAIPKGVPAILDGVPEIPAWATGPPRQRIDHSQTMSTVPTTNNTTLIAALVSKKA